MTADALLDFFRYITALAGDLSAVGIFAMLLWAVFVDDDGY